MHAGVTNKSFELLHEVLAEEYPCCFDSFLERHSIALFCRYDSDLQLLLAVHHVEVSSHVNPNCQMYLTSCPGLVQGA